MNKQQMPSAILALFLFGFSSLALATSSNEAAEAMKLTPNVEEGKKIYALCASCHSDNGWGKEDGSFPVIAGQHRSVVIKQLADIRARNRDNPTMYPFSGDDVIGGPQGLEDVAEYISQLPKNTIVGKGNGTQLEKGKKIFNQMCSTCHGDKGQGNEELFFPRLQGQHYAYTARQLQWIRDGRRKNANPAMLAMIKELDDGTLNAIADYISRIGNNKEKKVTFEPLKKSF